LEGKKEKRQPLPKMDRKIGVQCKRAGFGIQSKERGRRESEVFSVHVRPPVSCKNGQQKKKKKTSTQEVGWYQKGGREACLELTLYVGPKTLGRGSLTRRKLAGQCTRKESTRSDWKTVTWKEHGCDDLKGVRNIKTSEIRYDRTRRMAGGRGSL